MYISKPYVFAQLSISHVSQEKAVKWYRKTDVKVKSKLVDNLYPRISLNCIRIIDITPNKKNIQMEFQF